MNKIILIGNLTHTPEFRETSNGTPVCNFSIAVNRPYKDEDGNGACDFFNCTAWRELGENIARFCDKGKKIAIVGTMQQRRYEDKDGNERIAYDVIVSECEFLTPKNNESEEEEQEPVKPSKPAQTAKKSGYSRR